MADNQTDGHRPFNAAAHIHQMCRPEMDRFLTVSPIGRLGMTTVNVQFVLTYGLSGYRVGPRQRFEKV